MYLTIIVSVHILILEMFLMILFHTINYEVYSELSNIIYKFCTNMLFEQDITAMALEPTIKMYTGYCTRHLILKYS